MSNLPDLAILLLTYRRTKEALITIQSTIDNLIYPKEKIFWYVADDGSDFEHFQSIISLLSDNEQNIIGHHNERLRHEGQENSYNSGIGWNRGLGLCHQKTDFVLVCEDDWHLDEKLDILPYIQLLQGNQDVGICSFRILSAGADVHTVGHNGQMFLRYDRTTQYAFSGNPYLRHARYTKFYGWFAEDKTPGLIELHQDDMYRYKEDERGNFIPREINDGPHIWRPADISVWGSWKHIGSEKSWN